MTEECEHEFDDWEFEDEKSNNQGHGYTRTYTSACIHCKKDFEKIEETSIDWEIVEA